MPTLIRRQCHIAAAAVVRIIFLLQLLRLENVQKEKKNSAVSPPLISFDFDFSFLFSLLSPYVCVDISLVRLSSFLNFIMYFFLDSSSSFLDGRSKQQQRTKQQHQGFFLTQLRFPYAHSA